jgi:hypothetical protein
MQRGNTNTQAHVNRPKAKYEEYTAALSVFNDGMLNEAYRPLLESSSSTSSCKNETNTISLEMNPIYIDLYKKCKSASDIIQRYESIPGFLKSYNTSTSRRPGPRRLSNVVVSQSMFGPTSGVNRSNFRPGGKLPTTNSANSSVSSSARKRSLTPTLEVTSSDKATAPPQSAIKFLKALNSNPVNNASDTKRMRSNLNSKDSSLEDDKECSYDKDDSSSKSEQEELSGTVDMTTANDSIQNLPPSGEQPTLKRKDDSNIESKNQPEIIKTEIGSMRKTFDVGDDVLCYFETDQKWCECIVRNVHREIVHGTPIAENDPNTTVNVSPKRLSRRKNKVHQQVVTIVGYDVEYDDGTGEEHVDPKRIKDRCVFI